MSKRYVGFHQETGGCTVIIDGVTRTTLNKFHHERNHSPDGFQWGYGGSGPAQLAYALVRDNYDRDTTEAVYREFLREVVAQLPDEDFILEEQRVRRTVESIQDDREDTA